MSGRTLRRTVIALAAALFAAVLPLQGETLDEFGRRISQLERDLLTAAASKSGSYVQQEFEKQLSDMNNAARQMQFKVRRKNPSGRTDLVMPVLKLQDCYHKLKQGKERVRRSVVFKRTTDSDFRRAQRRALNDISKSDSSPEEKKRATENLYDSWLGNVKDYNLRRCGRLKSDIVRSCHEEYVAAMCELRRLVRQLKRSDAGL